MENVITINVQDINSIYTQFIESVKSKKYIIDMEFPDAHKWSSDDIMRYAEELRKVKTFIVNECKSGSEFIPFYPFINNLLSEENLYNENLIVCRKCPCRSCIQDLPLFEKITGANTVPFPDFCKRAFIDYEVFVEICEELEIESPPKINCREYWDLVLKSLANNQEGVDNIGL